jgi:DUF4097 and DUF4098 domain-containing protein YvlB
MKAREVFLLIIIIVVGVVFHHTYTGKWDFNWDEGFFFDTEEYTFTESQKLTPPFPLEIQVINRQGNIDIQGSTSDSIQIQLDKRIRRRSEESAQEIADTLHLVVEQDEARISVSTNREELNRHNFNTNFTLLVPEGMAVRIKNRYGRSEVSNLGDTDIINRNGEVKAWNITGNLTIQNSYEDIVVENVSRDCRVESRQSTVSLSHIKGKTTVIHRYGKLELENLEQNLVVDATHVQVYGKDLAGPLEVGTSYEELTLVDVGSVIIRADNSPISIRNARNGVEIQNRYAQIELENINGNVDVQGRDLGLHARSLKGDIIIVNTSFRDVDLEDFTGKTEITLSDADLSLRPADLTQPLDVKGSHCRITLYWPVDTESPIQAQTKNGEIRWELMQKPAVNVTNGISILKAFLESENPGVSLSTTYADIHIKNPE